MVKFEDFWTRFLTIAYARVNTLKEITSGGLTEVVVRIDLSLLIVKKIVEDPEVSLIMLIFTQSVGLRGRYFRYFLDTRRCRSAWEPRLKKTTRG